MIGSSSPRRLPIVTLVYREALSPVFASQVLDPLEAVQGSADVTLGLVTPVGQLWRNRFRAQRDEINKRCQDSGIPVSWIPSPPSRLPWLWSNVIQLRRWVSQRFAPHQPFIARCRNAEMTCMALNALRRFPQARVVYDCRGAEVCERIHQFEMEETPREDWPSRVVRRVTAAERREQRAALESAGIITVSHAMAAWLQQRYPAVEPQKYCVIPCCSDVERFVRASSEREIVRRELGLANRYVVTYLGSLARYQRPASSLRIFRLIQALRPEAHFLAITTDPTQMKSLAAQRGMPEASLTIRSVSSCEVPRLLAASDLGLLLRDRSDTNRVASPVKFGEYLAAGVPVVTTPGLGDCSDHVDQHQLGFEVDLTQNDAALIARLREWWRHSPREAILRERCQQFAAAHLSWRGNVPRLIQWYTQLMKESDSSAVPRPHFSGMT